MSNRDPCYRPMVDNIDPVASGGDGMDAEMTGSEVAMSEVINTNSGEDGMDAERTRRQGFGDP